jgi:RimJ/RimL family protein N-acetyltransferase
MLPEQIKSYRNVVTLRDGAHVLLRAMTLEDQQGLEELFAPLSDDDMLYFRDNVRDRAVIQRWGEDLDYERVLPLLALVRERIVGQATLHFGRGPKRHLGEVRIFLAKDFRQRGLGSRMLATVIDLAKKEELHALIAEIVIDQTRVIKAFQRLGFTLRATYEDYFMLPDGETRDVVVLMLYLRPRGEDF